MIVRVLVGFVIATLVILFIFWLATGGLREIADTAKGITNPFSFIWDGRVNLSSFRLPWQPENLLSGPVSYAEGETAAGDDPPSTEGELSESQLEYDALMKDLTEAERFGEPSPKSGAVLLSPVGATETSTSVESLELEAAFENTAPINVNGWSIQSALTGVRVYVPRGAPIFALGSVNTQSDIYLSPGSVSVVTTGASPVGTSFKENACTGYLAGMQSFFPPLERSCPSGSEALPLTPKNIQMYGEACYDFVQTIPACALPAETPAKITPSCRLFLANNLSYNGCVQNHRHESTFSRDSWRIYLNAGGELWRNGHDIIRLLDEEGRTVDVISY